ncbi:MAG: hypothetical protein ACE5HA_12605, partial [Anaerolineae bacterium]
MTRMHSSFLFAFLLVVGCTAIVALPLSSAAPATSDFTPCSGPGTPPPGAEGSTGPWAGRLMIAYSDDGLAWTRANRVLTDQADVPDAIVDDAGTLRVYYVTWCPDEVHNQIVAALAADTAQTLRQGPSMNPSSGSGRRSGRRSGQAWSYRRVTINGLAPNQPAAVDPDIARTDDGRWRLYFTSAPATPGATPRTYSAISDDGFTFELEAGYRLHVEGREVLDPSVIRIGDVWHLFAGGAVGTPGYNWHATSTDGLTFTLQDDFGIAGLTMANGLAVDGGYRFYGFRPIPNQPSIQPTTQLPTPQPTATEIQSVFTADGETWTMDPGARLSPDPSATLEALGVKDPAVARLPDGQYVMVYVTTIPEYLESGGDAATGNPRVVPASEASESWEPVPSNGGYLQVAAGPYADAEVLMLPGGGYRLYVEDLDVHNIVSFTSDDGLAWTRDNGVRVSNAAFPDAVRLPDGRVRLYFQQAGQINSAISMDAGLTFQMEAGARVEPGWHGDIDRDQVGASTTVLLPDGRFRMYYRAGYQDDAYFNGIKTVILSATSDDGLSWSAEAGVRVDPEDWVDPQAPADMRYLDGPEAVLTDDGHIKLYFWGVRVCYGVCLSESADGLTFERVEQVFAEEDTPTGQNAGDPTILPLASSPWLMYFGQGMGDDNAIWIARRAMPNDVPTPTPTPTQYPISNIQSPYLLSFHACDTATADCRDPRNHQVYLAQSDDGADWRLVPDWEPYQGSVPDVIRRGDTLYVYTPGRVRRYRFSTDTWEDPVPVTLTDPEATGGFVDPSLFVDDEGRLVLFYLLGIIGQNPAGCAPEETTCVKHFHSAIEVEGSDGTAFVAQAGDRVQVTISPSRPAIAADPDIFYDGEQYVLYISRGSSVQVYTSPTLHGSYALSDSLPDGYLVHGGGVPAGHFEPATSRYWTYVHTGEGVIRRATHTSLDAMLSDGDFTHVLTGSSIGLGDSYRVESPGFAVNTPATSTTPPPASQCVGDANGNGVGDVEDIMTTATDLPCHVYLPVVAANWRQPWPSATPTPAVEQLPINLVYVNHVEVESVLDYLPPPVDGTTYATTPEKYADTSGNLEWEMAQAEAVGARVSFHMSGAYAEQAVEAGAQAPWSGHLADGHTVGVHFHSFLRGPQPFQWTYSPSPSQQQIAQAWQDNHDLVADLVGAEALWIGESHYACPSCWEDLGYQLRTTEQMAQLPAGQHIVWLVERDRAGVITYPHFPQIGQAAWHGPPQNRNYFDLRVPQLKKEFLMLYLEWLERERLGLEPQVWAFGWLNHGGRNTDLYADEIQEMFTWMGDNFAGRTSPRGNVIAEFVSDHQLADRYKAYEQAGGQPLPPPTDNVNDQFPYMAHALEDAGVTADLSAQLGLPGVRLFELERAPAENPPPGAPPKVYLLFREIDGNDVVDISDVLASRGVDATNLTLINVVDGSTSPADGRSLLLGPTPLVLEAAAPPPASELNFVPDPGFRIEDASNPAASVDPETGTVYLFYEDRSTMPGRRMVATSSDGLSFSAGRPPTEADNP